jgi:signal transduction histidine kinase
MLDTLLVLSRLGTRSSQPEPCDLEAMINDYIIERKALNKDESLSFDVAMDMDIPEIIADRSRMVQLFTNIVDNAIKYRRGNTVSLTITGREKAGGVEIAFRDRGIGIHEKDLPRVFSIFFRGCNAAGSDQLFGWGVGLTIVKKIVEQQGGNVEIRSIIDEGTEVVIFLPVRPSANPADG